jgi:hypothetical protein
MPSERRQMLVHTLKQFNSLETIAIMSDEELYLQWLFDCKYEGGKDIIKEIEKSRDKKDKE